MDTVFDDDDSVRREGETVTEILIRDELTPEDLADPRWAHVTGVWHLGSSFPLSLVPARTPALELVSLSCWDSSGDDERHLRYVRDFLGEAKLPVRTLLLDLESDDSASLTGLVGALGALGGFPRLRTFGFDVGNPGDLGWLWKTVGRRVEHVRVASVDGPGQLAEWIPALADVPRNVASVELSLTVGWYAGHGWSMRVTRDASGALSEYAITARPMRSTAFKNPKVADIAGGFLDEIDPKAMTAFSLAVDGLRANGKDLEGVVASLGRHRNLKRVTLPGREPWTPTGARVASKSAEERRGAAEAARSAGFEGFRAWLSKSRLSKGMARALAIHEAKPASIAGAARALEAIARDKAKPSADLQEAALRVLELPLDEEALAHAALRVLERTRGRRVAARIVAVLRREDGCRWAILKGTSDVPFAFLAPEELPLFLDWYESIGDTTVPLAARNASVGLAVSGIVVTNGDGTTWDELTRRRDDGARKLSKWKREVYDGLLRDLEKKAKGVRRASPRKKA